MKVLRLSLLLVGTAGCRSALGFVLTPLRGGASTPRVFATNNNGEDEAATAAIPTNQVVQTVAVTGATGRLGKYVVEELLDRQVNVVALIRSQEKAKEIWGSRVPSNLKLVECDLTDSKQLKAALQDTDAAIWCATGFSQNTNWVERLQRLFGLATQQPSIDTVGLPLLAKALPAVDNSSSSGPKFPRIVMCSSAGVTRPQWEADKKKRLVGAADIPIVRLNPFGILDIKYESEQTLRNAATASVSYCIVRPSGLNDNWPAGSRPMISQGDVAVGRISRKDVANVLVDVLSIPEAVGKTFEVNAVADYPPPLSLRPVIGRLFPDGATMSEERIEATYHVLQQLLPGEKQTANELAMGQTYEQLDKDETGRLGARGKEKIDGVMTQTNGR